MLPNMKACAKHVMFPARFDKCPHCHEDAKSTWRPLTEAQAREAALHSIGRGDADAEQFEG